MSEVQKIEIRLGELCLENYAGPPDDPLGELSHFELGLRLFCYECNRHVLIEIGEERIEVFLDPDICMVLEGDLPQQIAQLERGKEIEMFFAESCHKQVQLVPEGHQINCTVREWGYSSGKKHFKLDKEQVLGVLRRFVEEVMEMAVGGGYITPAEKEEFLKPMQQEPVSQEVLA
ncbi:MAG: hypothetical protein KME26_28070 [Oscillatoria princeps RMCB-10]|jgi:hypothetical protein|nr:hypothetical protein [Oscillatoria princeps RMCB-10]